jgi:hypothetical protein
VQVPADAVDRLVVPRIDDFGARAGNGGEFGIGCNIDDVHSGENLHPVLLHVLKVLE